MGRLGCCKGGGVPELLLLLGLNGRAGAAQIVCAQKIPKGRPISGKSDAAPLRERPCRTSDRHRMALPPNRPSFIANALDSVQRSL